MFTTYLQNLFIELFREKNNIYLLLQEKAHKAMDYLWNQRHRSSDLVGTVINIHNGDWIRRGQLRYIQVTLLGLT